MSCTKLVAIILVSAVLISIIPFKAQAGEYKVLCSSDSYKYHYCRINGQVRSVRLYKRVSDTLCVKGSNWDYDRNGIWVSKGCQAYFVVNTYTENTVRCESNDYKYHYCRADIGNRVVLLKRKLSDSTCVKGVNWGYNRNGIWVNKGCRADFAVRGR
mgnify:CR=1 FL=1